MKIHCAHDKVVAIDKLNPHPKNNNKHPEDQIKRLAKILDYQGWRYPIKVSKQTGFITSGHARLEAAKLNGWKKVPVNIQEYESEEQEYADLTADNAIASWSELDLSAINAEIGALGPDFDIALLGIKDFALDISDTHLPELKSGDGSGLQQMAFIVSDSQAEEIKRALSLAKQKLDTASDENDNSNGNALATICEVFITQNGQS